MGHMAWKETCIVKERIKFMLEWEEEWERREGYVNMAALCRRYGVTRACGYKWVRRYCEGGRCISALADRCRRPKKSPHKTDVRLEDAIIRLRKKYPTWGPVTLRMWLQKRFHQEQWPSESTIGNILRRHGMTRRRKRRQKIDRHKAPLAHCDGPNVVWSMDFKGQFHVQDGTKVYPFTLFDNYSRFLFRCEGMVRPNAKEVIAVLRSAFGEFGLPGSIRSDNGPPFASKAPGGLSEVGVWLEKLRVAHERIEPGHPEQNARLERMHRTLKQHACKPPRASLRAQQRAFDRFRKMYNDERPHHSLRGKTPAEMHDDSARRLPRTEPPIDYPFAEELRQVDKNGRFQWGRRKIDLSTVLSHETVALEPLDDGRWSVFFGSILLGYIDPRKSSKLIRPRKRWKRV
jgi:transposase InsO family protein